MLIKYRVAWDVTEYETETCLRGFRMGAIEEFHRVLGKFDVNLLDTVKFRSKLPPCFKCGRHHEWGWIT